MQARTPALPGKAVTSQPPSLNSRLGFFTSRAGPRFRSSTDAVPGAIFTRNDIRRREILNPATCPWRLSLAGIQRQQCLITQPMPAALSPLGPQASPPAPPHAPFFPGTAGVPACINPGQSPTPKFPTSQRPGCLVLFPFILSFPSFPHLPTHTTHPHCPGAPAIPIRSTPPTRHTMPPISESHATAPVPHQAPIE
jgi:hypothetical protein